MIGYKWLLRRAIRVLDYHSHLVMDGVMSKFVSDLFGIMLVTFILLCMIIPVLLLGYFVSIEVAIWYVVGYGTLAFIDRQAKKKVLLDRLWKDPVPEKPEIKWGKGLETFI